MRLLRLFLGHSRSQGGSGYIAIAPVFRQRLGVERPAVSEPEPSMLKFNYSGPAPNERLTRTTLGMHLLRSLICSAAVFSVLTGCCAFVPCHPATSLIGAVRDANGRPVTNATVTLYGTTISTDSKGCFNLHAPDASPFTLDRKSTRLNSSH